MISQGWPLYAVRTDEHKIYAIVGWYEAQSGELSPQGVELTEGSGLPYAVELIGCGPMVVTPDLDAAIDLIRPS